MATVGVRQICLMSELLQSQNSSKGPLRTLLAAVLSVFLPGVGHLLIKRRGTGIVFLTITCGLFFVCWPLRLLYHFAALIGFALGMLADRKSTRLNSSHGYI